MVNYQKYMFDDFVVNTDKEDVVADIQIKENELSFDIEETQEDNIETTADETVEEIILEDNKEEIVKEQVEENKTEDIIEDIKSYDYVQEAEVEENLAVYTEEEFKEALSQAEEIAYNKGLEEAKNSLEEKQNILLEDIKNQLMTIFASLEDKKSDMEISMLNFAVSMVRKLLPTLEKERAEKEVKNFLAENFANFSSQEALSFSFHPDIISKVADSIGRLAEQNDFEGKISVHKDVSLGLSDCRVEWKSGGVERKTSNVINNVENLININNQERENG